jgi:hypothetical protein
MIRRLFFLPFAFLLSGLACYGEAGAGPYATFNGNWRLSTGGGAFQHPDQFFTFYVHDSTLFADGEIALSCTGDDQAFETPLRGQIKSDGSFKLEGRLGPSGAQATTISGQLPAAGQTQWLGSITVAAFRFKPTMGANPATCPDATADFTATPLPRIDGIYSGTLNSDKTGADGNVNLAVVQGGLSALGCAGRSAREIRVMGRMIVTGSSQFPSGTYDTQEGLCGSAMFGRGFRVKFSRRGGSSADLSAQAEIDPSDNSRVRLTLSYGHRDETGKFSPHVGVVQLTRNDDQASR